MPIERLTESSVADALGGLWVNRAAYYENKHGYVFKEVTEPGRSGGRGSMSRSTAVRHRTLGRSAVIDHRTGNGFEVGGRRLGRQNSAGRRPLCHQVPKQGR
jgi:hypothetical protein